MATNRVYLGTELKININISPLDNLTMDDYDFLCVAFCNNSKKLEITKQECVKVDSNNYIIKIDTKEIGPGLLKIKVEAHIPDSDFSDFLRTEVTVINTGISIEKIN